MRFSPRLTKKNRQLSYERLERRCLLAGDVSVALDGSVLVVSGDDLANQIDVAQADNGDVVFTGRDNTTINGQAEFTFSEAFDRARFELNDGADEVVLDGFEGVREFRFLGGDGNDRLEANGLVADFYHIRGNDGNDAVELVTSSARRSAYLFLGDGDDVVAVDSFDAGRNFKVLGGNGDDTFASNSLSVERKFRLNLGSGNDQALLSGQTNVERSARIRLGSGDDFLGVLPDLDDAEASFERSVSVDAGRGDDAVVIGSSTQFDRTARFNGRSGSDSIELGEFDGRSRVRRFEIQEVVNVEALLDQVFERLDAVEFDSSQFGNTLAESTIEVELPDTQISFVENESAVAVASDLNLQADAGEDIVLATIELQNGDSFNDVLSFEDQNGIVGSFDPQTTTLTLLGAASASQYETAIQSVLFESLGDNPLAGLRTLSVAIQSELSVEPLVVSRPVEVVAVDDPLNLVLPGQFGGDIEIQGTVDQLIEFTVEDPDPDNPVVFELDLEQSGISEDASQPSIDPQTGEFQFNPSETGTFLIRVIATNDDSVSDQEEFTLTIGESQLAIGQIEDQTLGFNESLEIPVQATQANLDSPLSFELEASGDAVEGTSNLPVISDTGVITWTPDLLTNGTATFEVTVTDANQVTATEIFDVDLPGFVPFQGNRQLASVDPLARNDIYGDSFEGDGPPNTIDQSLDYTATISTEVGDIVVNLFQDQTPISVNSFVNLAEDGYYDGLSFHRVVESPIVDDLGLPVLDDEGDLQFERFVAQGGDPTNTSTGGPGFRINDEILPELTFDRPGILAYARTNAPNSNGSQFFITYDATEFQNDEDFTIFGEVVDFGEVIDGQNALDRLNLTDPTDDDPATPTLIESITIATS